MKGGQPYFGPSSGAEFELTNSPVSALMKLICIIGGPILLILSRSSTEEGLSYGICVFIVGLYVFSGVFTTQRRIRGGGQTGGDPLMKKLKEIVEKKFPSALNKLKNTDAGKILSSLNEPKILTNETEILNELIDMVGKQGSGRRNTTRRA